MAPLSRIRVFIHELATAAGVDDSQALANTWHILMKGSIIAATEGNRSAARDAKRAATLILDHWRGF
jgi:hypothetical protein